MSSTDERRVARLFEDALVPAAEALRERGVRFFPMGPDDDASWYAPPPEGPDFFALEPDQCGAALRTLWEAQQLPELAGLVDGLVALAADLDVADEETPDISPFVYVMY